MLPDGAETIASLGISYVRVRTPRILSRIFKAGYAGTVLVGLAQAYEVFFAPFFATASLVGVGLIVLSFVLSLVQRSLPGAVSVSTTELVIARGNTPPRIVPRSQIVSALVVRRYIHQALAPVVEIRLRNGDGIDVRLADFDAATALVHKLGFGPNGARLHVELAKPASRLLHLPFAIGVHFLTTFMSIGFILFRRYGAIESVQLFLPLVELAIYYLVVRLLAAPTVVVGRDGVLVERGFSKKLFRATDPALFGALMRGTGDGPRAHDVLRVAHERAVGAAAGGNLFERGGLSLDAWRGRIAGAMDGGYRTTGNVPDLARSVLASADVAPDERIGAALALRVAGDLDTVRIAASAMADERVRVVLDAVAAGADDEVVEKRLRRL